jgi:hypothetical protein
MDFEAKNTSTSSANTSPNISTSGTSNMEKRATMDVIAETFPSFDPQAAVVGPYEEDAKCDAEFTERAYSSLLWNWRFGT